MDETVKKFFARLDAPYPGERVNALDMLYDHLQKAGQTFRDILHELESAVAPQKFADLQTQYNTALQEKAKALQDNAAFNQRYQQDQQELAKLRRTVRAFNGMLWLQANWQRLAGIGALLAVGSFGIQWWNRTPWPDYADGALRIAVGKASWERAEAIFNKPVVVPLGTFNKPYWVLLRGEVDQASYVDPNSNPIVMRCIHVYAAPAEPGNGGQYYRPHPYSLFGFGWLQWPERLVDCQKSPDQVLGQK